jgi:23S rRNA pseudouridine1911/1915/1917 synthase
MGARVEALTARSPAAERHDPPLVVRRFVTGPECTLAALLAEIASRLAGTGASAERTLWHGGVHVNGRPLDPDALPARIAAGAWVVAYAFEREPAPLPAGPPRILHDGDGIVAVAKPPWLPMQRTRASARFTLEAALRAALRDVSLVAAHRLDRQTSGVAVFARGAAGAWASRAFALRQVRKRYLAVVAPPPESDELAVEGWIARAPDPARFRFALHREPVEASRYSATRFRVLARGAGRARLEAWPETGRTHQLRVHLAARGHPVVGDDLYGAPFAPGAAASAERVLLHAAHLALSRRDGSVLRLEAGEPEDLAVALSP